MGENDYLLKGYVHEDKDTYIERAVRVDSILFDPDSFEERLGQLMADFYHDWDKYGLPFAYITSQKF
jgi:hypothetical protein